jgi:purine nucleosidase
MKVHLDTDLGGDTDDLCALAYLLGRRDVDLVGVTTCCGFTTKRAGYARYALDLAGRRDVPVVPGADGSIGGYRGFDAPMPGLPDEATMWPEAIPPVEAEAGAALSLLATSAEAGATIVGIGTYTNVAMLAAVRPALAASTRFVLLGGYLGRPAEGLPRWGPEMDWNVQQDLVASRILLTRCRPTLVPLGVSLRVHLRAADLPSLEAGGPLPRLLARQARAHARENGMEELGRRHAALPDDLRNFQYDPLACAVAAGWPGARVEEMGLSLEEEDGWLWQQPDPDGRLRLPVVTEVDGEAFRKHWLETVLS